jgi:glycosyltransferase involved in cell wall biosynthesis
MRLGGDRYGGIEKICLDMVKALVNSGQEVTVAAPEGSEMPEGVDFFIPTVNLPQEQDRDSLIENIVTGIDDWDVIHDYTHHHVFKDSDRTIHMMHDPIRTRFDFKAKKNVLCYSEWQAKRFEAMYGQKALVMPLNFVDTDVFKPDPQAKRERFLFLGKMTPDKGADLALRYCEELGYPIDIVGGLIPSDGHGYAAAVEEACRSSKVDAGFHFNVTETEKLKFLQNAKALIYPQSLDDSHWLTGIEAWATGCPTVCYNHGAMLEVCPNPFFVCDSETEFKNRMFKIDDYDIADALRRVDRDYSVKAILPKWLQLYSEVANGRTWA